MRDKSVLLILIFNSFAASWKSSGKTKRFDWVGMFGHTELSTQKYSYSNFSSIVLDMQLFKQRLFKKLKQIKNVLCTRQYWGIQASKQFCNNFSDRIAITETKIIFQALIRPFFYIIQEDIVAELAEVSVLHRGVIKALMFSERKKVWNLKKYRRTPISFEVHHLSWFWS